MFKPKWKVVCRSILSNKEVLTVGHYWTRYGANKVAFDYNFCALSIAGMDTPIFYIVEVT